ncbi:MAG: hypothetical protein QXE06_01255 [Candidatus Bathyarchaeia archaeon]
MKFQCPTCGNKFNVSRLKLFFVRCFSGYKTSARFPKPDPTIIPDAAYYLKCPKCGKKSWVTPLH